jgi:phospholipid/cholesterol/gamma-HCH transport system substrate-binding protein
MEMDFNVIIRMTSVRLGVSEEVCREAIMFHWSNVHDILSNVESISVNFKNNGAKIDAVLNNLTTTTDKMAALNFKQTVDNANKAMSDLQLMIADIKAGKGSIGKLINDEQMYQNLNNASKNLDALMIDLKANPKRYVHFSVFGKNNKVDK